MNKNHLFIFLLLFIPSVNSLNFYETFGNAAFYNNKTTIDHCYNYPSLYLKDFNLTGNVNNLYNVTFNNRSYYCFNFGRSTGSSIPGPIISNVYNNYSNYVNSANGLKMLNYHSAPTGSARWYGILHLFNESTTIRNNIQIYASKSTTNVYNAALGFFDYRGNISRILEFSSATCGNTYTNATINVTCFEMDDGSGIGTNTKTFINYTLTSDIEDVVGYFIAYNGLSVDATEYLIVDDISFDTTLNSSSNSIPVVNDFSFNDSICYNSSFTSMSLPLNINVTDAESDTIYYSIYGLKSFLEYEINYEDFLDNDGNPDLQFFTRGNYQSNRSYPTTLDQNRNYILSDFGYYDFYGHGIGEIVGQTILVTNLDNQQPWYYSANTPLSNSSTLSFNLMFPDKDMGVDYILYDSLNNRLLNVSIHVNESYWLTIYYDGILNQSLQFGRFTPSNTSNELYIINSWSPSGITTYINDGLDRTDVILHKNIQSSNIYKIGFHPHYRQLYLTQDFEPVYFLSELEINGYNYVPQVDWTTTKPSSISMTSSSTSLKLYVSDSVHIPNNYNTELLYITIPNCLYHADIGYTSQDTPLVFFTDVIKTPLNDYIITLGLEDIADKFLWLLWFILFVLIMGTQLLITKEINFSYPFIGATVLCLICSILVGYPLHIITYLILLAFVMARPMIEFIGGM